MRKNKVVRRFMAVHPSFFPAILYIRFICIEKTHQKEMLGEFFLAL